MKLCALAGCTNPVPRRKGDSRRDYDERTACCPEHGAELRRLAAINSPKLLDDSMSRSKAVRFLTQIPPRLLPMLEELPPEEQRKAIQGWREGVRMNG